MRHGERPRRPGAEGGVRLLLDEGAYLCSRAPCTGCSRGPRKFGSRATSADLWELTAQAVRRLGWSRHLSFPGQVPTDVNA
jgi:hypothetical protein